MSAKHQMLIASAIFGGILLLGLSLLFLMFSAA
jgi:hypothetical protein